MGNLRKLDVFQELPGPYVLYFLNYRFGLNTDIIVDFVFNFLLVILVSC